MIGGVPSRGGEVAGPSQRLPRVELKHAATARQAEDGRLDSFIAASPREDVQNIVCRVVGHALEVIGPVSPGTTTAAESIRGSECLFPYHSFELPGPRGDFEDRIHVVVCQPERVIPRNVGAALTVFHRDPSVNEGRRKDDANAPQTRCRLCSRRRWREKN
jgi:hypothetical protein